MRDKRGQEPRICPNKDCKNHHTPSFDFCKDGFHQRTMGKKEKVQKYRCKACGKRFHGTYGRLTYRQKKPEINSKFLRTYTAGVSFRRTAFLLRVNRKTLAQRIISHVAFFRKKHEQSLQDTDLFFGTRYSFDEMESKVGSKKNPVSISIAVNEDSGRIVDIQVSKMPLKGRIIEKIKKQGLPIPIREDFRPEGRVNALGAIAIAANGDPITIFTDGGTSYPDLISQVVRNAKHSVVPHYRNLLPDRNRHDNMFWHNHVCARIRADVSRLARRSWCFSRSIDALQAHLDMFMEYFNNRVYTARP